MSDANRDYLGTPHPKTHFAIECASSYLLASARASAFIVRNRAQLGATFRHRSR